MRFAFGASAANAGTIASSSGKPIAAPAPFKNVRRGKSSFGDDHSAALLI